MAVTKCSYIFFTLLRLTFYFPRTVVPFLNFLNVEGSAWGENNELFQVKFAKWFLNNPFFFIWNIILL